MRTVRDENGTHYLLVKESGDSSLVRDPRTGEQRYLENDGLEYVEGDSPLATAAAAVPEPVRRLLTGVPNEEALGLLVELVDRGPLPAATVVDATDRCESDLNGLLTSLRIAGLVTEATVHDERGYDATAEAREAIATLRDA